MTDREKIAAKIRALRAKTVENGCTEDEAVAAARKVAEMLATYNMTLEEAEMRASPFQKHRQVIDDPVGERLWKIGEAISFLTGAVFWTTPAGAAPEVNFFGFNHEVDAARYLMNICERAMRDEAARQLRGWSLLVPARKRRKLAGFLDGMADRLARRIRQQKPPAPTGTGLVVLHRELVMAGLADTGTKLDRRQMRGSWDMGDEYLAGLMAGDRVALNRGVRGPDSQNLRRLT